MSYLCRPIPIKRTAILTCMDSRIDLTRLAGQNEGDAYVIRNPGGRASDDAIRSLIISYKLFGTTEWFVIHHSKCGLELFTDEVIRAVLVSDEAVRALRASTPTTPSNVEKNWKEGGPCPGSHRGDFIDWLTTTDQAQYVALDVERIRKHPLVPGHIPIHGYIYQVETGRLVEVLEASQIGRATMSGIDCSSDACPGTT